MVVLKLAVVSEKGTNLYLYPFHHGYAEVGTNVLGEYKTLNDYSVL